MREGSLEAPVRRPLDWRNPDFHDPARLEAELRRVFDICHGCRRCFNLCDSFPRLFDLVDAAGDAELAGVASADLGKVADACTLCDMCFMTKCPYVPPHTFDLDFPHLMVRYRAVALKHQGVPFALRQLTETDRNGRLAGLAAPLVNWAAERGNGLTRPLMEKAAKIHREAPLPRFHGKTFLARARAMPPAVDADAPALGRKAALFATCFVNYNNPAIGVAAQAVLARNGVDVAVAYAGCCGMPQLELGDIARVAQAAERTAAALAPLLDEGRDIVVPIPSCALMMKFEWPLILPEHEGVRRLAQATFDLSEYVVDIARREGLAPGMRPLDGGISIHLACHARAQNMGPKGAELLRLIPQAEVAVIERCSGHGGSWGILADNYPTALKVGRPVVRQVAKNAKRYVVSECPLAGQHIVDGLGRHEGDKPAVEQAFHPIELMARAYGL